jgi:hypothetical protein
MKKTYVLLNGELSELGMKEQLLCHFAASEVLTAVVMMIYVFWDITLYIPLKVNQRFGERVASIFMAEE